MRVRLAIIGLLTLLLGLVVASPALAAVQQPTLESALHFLVGPGAAVLAGLFISVGMEYWPAFQRLEQKWKVAVYFVLCVGIALGAQAVAIATQIWGSWGDFQTTWWPALWAGIAASGIGTFFHAWAPSPLRKTEQ